MHIAVMGSGAMGSLFGGHLADAGQRVTLIDRGQAHVDAMNETGLVIETPGGARRVVDVNATTSPGSVTDVDLLVVFVKSPDTAQAIADAAPMLDGADVLTLQNGLGNPETLAEFVEEQTVIAGVTAHGSTERGPGQIRHAGRGPTTIGRYFVEIDEPVHEIAGVFTEAGIETTVSPTIVEAIREKVIVNVGINPLTALARVRNGRLVESDHARRLLAGAVGEAVAVTEAEGVSVRDDIVDHVLDVADRTAENRSSMRQDVEAGRRTEIESLNGEIVRRGHHHGIETPVNRMLTDLIRVAEQGDIPEAGER